MGESTITYAAIGTGLLIFSAIFGIVWAVIDSKSKARDAKERESKEDRDSIYKRIDRVEGDLEKSIKVNADQNHSRINKIEDDNKALNRDLGRAEGRLEVIQDLVTKKLVEG